MQLRALVAYIVLVAACKGSPPPRGRAVGENASPRDASAGRADTRDAAPATSAPDGGPVHAATPDAASPDAASQACVDSNDCTRGALCCDEVRDIPRAPRFARPPAGVTLLGWWRE
jgi:hypothetical protein